MVVLLRQTLLPMKRVLVTIKKKVDPTHKLIATDWVTDEELTAIRKKYGNQFDPDEPIIQYLTDQLVMVSFLVWINE
jgi:hypothetical protein